jgi:hypothetical protein
LTLTERREILKSYTNDAEIDDDVALMYNFFPLMCSKLYDDDKQKDILDFFNTSSKRKSTFAFCDGYMR